MPELTILAVLAFRNESKYLRVLLPLLAEQRIAVAGIDHDSTDETPEVLRSYWGAPIIAIERLPFTGTLSMSKQLLAKKALISRFQHDWIVNQDADEILDGAQPGQGLREAVEDAERGGYTALNFEEFVFIPESESDYTSQNYYFEMLQYYFFKPAENRLNRAWKRCIGASNLAAGGHKLTGSNIRIAPQNHVLRHYMVLSQAHASVKYLNRVYDSEDLAKGWHHNRLAITEAGLRLPNAAVPICRLRDCTEKPLRTDRPTPLHYWQW